MTVGIEGAMEESAEAKVVAESVTAAAEEASGTVILEDASAPGEASTASDSVLSDVRALKGILEALLFVTTEPIPTAKFVSLLGAVTRQDVERTLAELSRDYEQEGRGLQLVEVAGGYRLVTKGEFAPWLKRLEKTKAPSKLSRSALESLAIIAYKQPIVRAEVEQIRGVETSGVIRTLLERKLVRIVGRKEEPGRPIMYGTTKFFLEHFGLRDLSQLPPLREFKELGEAE
ncbi:MAG: SMC-Scp complex subunit ScpB, partial [Nitrospira sp.]|nr:SMC-Scp complex subunit ScpB [Nitrospira sp.]